MSRISLLVYYFNLTEIAIIKPHVKSSDNIVVNLLIILIICRVKRIVNLHCQIILKLILTLLFATFSYMAVELSSEKCWTQAAVSSEVHAWIRMLFTCFFNGEVQNIPQYKLFFFFFFPEKFFLPHELRSVQSVQSTFFWWPTSKAKTNFLPGQKQK